MSEEYQDMNSKQTILQHGIGVWHKFKQLIAHLESNSDSDYKHPLPSWIKEYKDILLPIINDNIADIQTYLIYHDCGKPFALTIDQNGKRHFYNHAEISKATFLKYSDNQFIADLIGNDMLCHSTKAKDYQSLLNIPNIEILLCAALAELHSNASMFGGFDCDSFKIKFKNLNKLGERILAEKYPTTESNN
jgi:hypothetical protein